VIDTDEIKWEDVSFNQRILVIESPYAASGDYKVSDNARFARGLCRSALKMGYIPLASHLFFTQFLDDGDATERRIGISSGLNLVRIAHDGKAQVGVWYATRPYERASRGMKVGLETWKKLNVPVWKVVADPSGAILFDIFQIW
jgi:hypothetical protein